MSVETREVDADALMGNVRHFHRGTAGSCPAGKRCVSACGVEFTHVGGVILASEAWPPATCNLCIPAGAL